MGRGRGKRLQLRNLLVVRQAASACLAIVVACTSVAGANSARAADAPTFGNSPTLRQDALRALPLSKLSPQGKSLSKKIIDDTTIFRRMPVQVIECDAEMFSFLVEHPDVVINIWDVLGVTKVSMKRIGPNSFRLDDGNGTTGDIHFLYRSPTQYVVYCEGTYSGSLLTRPIRGRCLLSLRSVPVRDAEERDYIQCRLDSFVQIDNVGADLFAKTFQSLLGGIADHNFRETTGFVAKVSEAAEDSPENVRRIADRLDQVPIATRRRFTEIGDRIGAEAIGVSASRTAARPGDVKK